MTIVSLQDLSRILISLAPVFILLVTLKFLDSYKLLKPGDIFVAVGAGAVAAVLSYFINNYLLGVVELDSRHFSRYDAPLIEEFLKGLYLYYLIRTHKVGFRVDSAIYGFALGAGFALVENVFFLRALPDAGIWVWIVRGLGTAVMHGGTTAIFGILAKTDVDQRNSSHFLAFFPGLSAAVIIHSIFNHFFLPPLMMTLVMIVFLPPLLYLVFKQSEISTRNWLDVGFDTDQELFDMITSEKITGSKIGIYLQSLKESYPPEVLIDILCYLRVYLELSIKAKGHIMLKEMGFEPDIDPSVQALFDELKYLENSIGKTGKMAISQFLSTSKQDIWQLKMLANKL